MPQSHRLSLTQSVLTVKQHRHKLVSWLCSTTFIVSPVLADAFDFRVEQDALGQVLHVERFDHKRLRPDSPEGSSRKASFRLKDHPFQSQIEHDGLILKLGKDETGTKIRVKLFKGKESLGYLDVKDDGTVVVSTKATSDHLFITSTKDIQLEGHTSNGRQECSLTLQTDANVYLGGFIHVQALSVAANRIISDAEIEASKLMFKARDLETVGIYRCHSVDVDVDNDWNNRAQFAISGCLTVRARSLQNRKRIEASQFVVRSLLQFDNTSLECNVPEFRIHETANLSGLSSFVNKGNAVFMQGANIDATDSIVTGTMTILSGDVRLSAKKIDVEARTFVFF
jgi:hypothetical protein